MRKPKGANIFHQLIMDKRMREVPQPDVPKVGYVMNSYTVERGQYERDVMPGYHKELM